MFTLKLYRNDEYGNLTNKIIGANHIETYTSKDGDVIRIDIDPEDDFECEDCYWLRPDLTGLPTTSENFERYYQTAILENANGRTTQHFRPALPQAD